MSTKAESFHFQISTIFGIERSFSHDEIKSLAQSLKHRLRMNGEFDKNYDNTSPVSDLTYGQMDQDL